MEAINIHRAKTNFFRLLSLVEPGEEIVISNRGTPVAKLVPFQTASNRRASLGQDQGTKTFRFRLKQVCLRAITFIPRLRKVIPRLRKVIPRLREVIPRLREVIPRLREVIPRLREVIPRLREVTQSLGEKVILSVFWPCKADWQYPVALLDSVALHFTGPLRSSWLCSRNRSVLFSLPKVTSVRVKQTPKILSQ